MRMTRTYPRPDEPSANLGPRERALAVYKYLADVEPEQAVKHPLFAVIVHAFEQTAILAIRKFLDEEGLLELVDEMPEASDSVCEPVGPRTVEMDAVMRRYKEQK